MRRNPTKRIEQFRIKEGPLASDSSYGANGAFELPYGESKVLMHYLYVIASDGSDWNEGGLPGEPWEHVSVSLPHRCPVWEEMDFVKRIFWRDDETVMQLHVPRAAHINFHNHCLHLWKPLGSAIPLPPPETVGPSR